MPIALKRSQLKYKNPETGTYVGVDAVAEKTTAEMISEVESAGHAKLTEINARATEVQASLPKVGEMEDIVAVPFVQSEPYPEGAYVIQTVSGVNYLYKLPDGHTAGVAWGEFTVIGPITFTEELTETVKELVAVQDEQPESPENKVWLTETPPEPIVIPTFDDFVKLPQFQNSNSENIDLDIADKSGNVIARLAGGGIQVKNFNSGDIGDLRNLSTTTKTTIVGAINSAVGQIDSKAEIDDENTSPTKTYSSSKVQDVLDDISDDIDGLHDDLSETNRTVALLPNIENSLTDEPDLDIADKRGNVIARFQGGSIKVKDFDSSDVGSLNNLTTTDKSTIIGAINEVGETAHVEVERALSSVPKTDNSDVENVDLDIADDSGNVILRLSGGHIRTSKFNSKLQTVGSSGSNAISDLDVSDVNGNVILRLSGGHIQTKSFESKYMRQLTGKKWTVIGDSLTEHNSRATKNYHDYIAEETGITVVNLGRSGRGYAKESNGMSFMGVYANIPTDTDVITIFGSGNDFSAHLDLGEITDTTTETLCGCINITLDNIYHAFPLVPIGVITPTPWTGSEPSAGDTNMSRYSAKIVEICARRGIPCLDLFHCSNLHPGDAAFREIAYSRDEGNGVHPDETGHKIIAPRFREFLFTLI